MSHAACTIQPLKCLWTCSFWHVRLSAYYLARTSSDLPVDCTIPTVSLSCWHPHRATTHLRA